MKQQVRSVALALCLCISLPSVAYASQEGSPQQEAVLPETPPEGMDPSANIPNAPAAAAKARAASPAYPSTLQTSPDISNLTPMGVYEAMIALRDQEQYKEGTPWTNDEPYSDTKGYYHWKGGTLGGANISAVGCVAFAFTLSDAAFGDLPSRMYGAGQFAFEDIKPGDILRVNNDVHTVIVLEVSESGVVVAEGNISTGDNKGKVHWGRGISKDEVMSSTSHYITRYPEGYVSPDDPSANVSIGSGTLGGLSWNLTKAGTLTISGQGAMPDYSMASEQPWSENSGNIRKVIIGDGVTNIGSCAFWDCGVLSAEISSSVTSIGNSAFRGSQILSVTIPSNVKTIGDNAFQACMNLGSVTIQEGVETISQSAFQSCGKLSSIVLPASIGEVGSAAFFQCQELKSVKFTPGSKQVKLGDNLFTKCYYLTSVTLPTSIDRIGVGMFQNCISLAGVQIPKDAGSIGQSAFSSCSSLTTVIIPDSVTSIGIAAFADCPLTDIYFTGSEAQWNSISKIGDTQAAVSNVTKHYDYVPAPPDSGDGDNNNPGGDNSGGDNSGDNNNPGGDNSGDSNNPGGDNSGDNNNPGGDNSGDNNNPGGDNSGDNNNPGGDNSGDNNNPGGDNSGDNNNPGGDNSGDNNNPGGDNSGGNNNPGGGNSGDNNNSGSNKPDGDNNNSGNGNNNGNGSSNGSSNKPGNNTGSNTGSGSGSGKSSGTSSGTNTGINAAAETWKPATPDEKKRYACVGKEAVRYTSSKDNAYQVSVTNAMQGPMCFKSFEAVLGDYTIGRTYNIYPPSGTAYSMDKEIQITLNIPAAVYRENRDYKMICVTENGQPIVYNDLDNNPGTITIKTNKFYAYALIYK